LQQVSKHVNELLAQTKPTISNNFKGSHFSSLSKTSQLDKEITRHSMEQINQIGGDRRDVKKFTSIDYKELNQKNNFRSEMKKP